MTADSWEEYREALATLETLRQRRQEARLALDADVDAQLAASRERAERSLRETDAITVLVGACRSRFGEIVDLLGAALTPLPADTPQVLIDGQSPVAVHNELMRLSSWADTTTGEVASLKRTLDREAASTPSLQAKRAEHLTPALPAQKRRSLVIALIAALAVCGAVALVLFLLRT